MESKRIAFQGEPGAYSEEALFLLEPHAVSQPYREFRDVAEAVVERRADLGLLPIENSLVGSIATNFDLIAESGLAIVGEVVSSVHHCLLGVAGASRESLRRVLSHPVALAQCERFLRQLAGVEVVAFYDTAGAAAEVARRGDRSLAARSEEHTSELQSHVNLVCRLLLEKKKDKKQRNTHLIQT